MPRRTTRLLLLVLALVAAPQGHADSASRFTKFAFPKESVIHTVETKSPFAETLHQRMCMSGAPMPAGAPAIALADANSCEAVVLEDTATRAVSETRCRVGGVKLTLERLDATTVKMTSENIGSGPSLRTVSIFRREGTPCTPETSTERGAAAPEMAAPKADEAQCREGLAELHRMRTSPPPDAPPETMATIIAGMEGGLRQLGCL
ncbi:MAG: hypothetical protein ACRC2H_12630 [Silanimonas sp.]